MLGSGSGSGSSRAEELGALAGHIRVIEKRSFPSLGGEGGKGSSLSSESKEKDPIRGPGKRSRKSWMKSKKVVANYVLGEDIGWEKVLHMMD